MEEAEEPDEAALLGGGERHRRRDVLGRRRLGTLVGIETARHRRAGLPWWIVLVLLAAACSDDRPRNFVNAFAPPAPRASTSTDVEPASSIAPAPPSTAPAPSAPPTPTVASSSGSTATATAAASTQWSATRSVASPTSTVGGAPGASTDPTTAAREPAASTATSPTTAAPVTTTARTTTTPPTTQPALRPPRRVLVIGDSSAAAMRWVAGATTALRGAHFTLDLESCRRLVEPSCTGREGYRPSTAIQALRRQAPGDHDTLVIAAGYNDTYDRFNEAFELILSEADRQGIETILWATYRENVGYELPSGLASGYQEMNRALGLRALSGNHPELQILDWRTYTVEAPGWLAGDGVHYRRAGAYGMADLISRSVAALDGRPCPVPWEPGSPRMDPCPPPLVELERRGGVPPVIELYVG